MKSDYCSKHGTVSKEPSALYMTFVDMRNVLAFLPEDKKQNVTADYSSVQTQVQGFNVGAKITERVPYSKICIQDDGAPFNFWLTLHFDPADSFGKTDFYIELTAELNFLMKTMLGSKIKDALNQVVDAMVAASEGRMPEGFDPSQYGF